MGDYGIISHCGTSSHTGLVVAMCPRVVKDGSFVACILNLGDPKVHESLALAITRSIRIA